jgi:hypothetical protein
MVTSSPTTVTAILIIVMVIIATVIPAMAHKVVIQTSLSDLLVPLTEDLSVMCARELDTLVIIAQKGSPRIHRVR